MSDLENMITAFQKGRGVCRKEQDTGDLLKCGTAGQMTHSPW